MIVACLYLIIEIFLFLNIIKFKKSDNVLSVATQLPLYIVQIMCFHAFIAGILSLFKLPVTLISIGVVDFISALLIYWNRAKKGDQKFEINKRDISFYFLLTIGVLLFGLFLFGEKLEIHFWSVDASSHYSMAQYVALNHSFNTNLYFSALNNGLSMMVMKPFIGERYLYKVFIVMELFDLWIAGALFYAFINQIKHDKGFNSIIISAMYLLGYPLYAIIFGFSYFGAAISLMVSGMCFIEKYAIQDIKKIEFMISMNLILFSLFVCYTYFVPVMFGTVFIWMIFITKKETGKLISKEMIFDQLHLFLLPCCVGMIFSVSNLKELGSGGGITNPGGCYFDLYSNFIIFILFIITGIFLTVKEKKILSIHLLSLFSLLFLFMLLMMNYHGRASLYYVSKIYNVLWFVAFVYIYMGLDYFLIKLYRLGNAIIMSVLISIIVSVITVNSVFFVSRGYVRNNMISFVPDIYLFNFSSRKNPYILDSEIDSYRYISTNYAGNNNQQIISIGTEIKCGWFKTISSQEQSISYDITDIDSKINSNVKYLYCMTSSPLVRKNENLLASLGKIIHSDDFGFVVELE